jgi:hypothetical protein
MEVKIKLEIFQEILYFLNWLLRHMSLGGVGEYSRLSRLIWRMYQSGNFSKIQDLTKYPAINGVLKHFHAIERMEGK